MTLPSAEFMVKTYSSDDLNGFAGRGSPFDDLQLRGRDFKKIGESRDHFAVRTALLGYGTDANFKCSFADPLDARSLRAGLNPDRDERHT